MKSTTSLLALGVVLASGLVSQSWAAPQSTASVPDNDPPFGTTSLCDADDTKCDYANAPRLTPGPSAAVAWNMLTAQRA